MDPELVCRAKLGDRQALEQLLQALTPPLWRLARRLCGDEEEAEDLVTEALYRGATKLRKLRDTKACLAWFRRILVNEWRDSLRGRRSRDLLLGDVPEPLAPATDGPEARLEGLETRAAFERELATLPPGQRAVLTLSVFEGLAVADIARELDSTADRVKANLWHARAKLRARLAEPSEDDRTYRST